MRPENTREMASLDPGPTFLPFSTTFHNLPMSASLPCTVLWNPWVADAAVVPASRAAARPPVGARQAHPSVRAASRLGGCILAVETPGGDLVMISLARCSGLFFFIFKEQWEGTGGVQACFGSCLELTGRQCRAPDRDRSRCRRKSWGLLTSGVGSRWLQGDGRRSASESRLGGFADVRSGVKEQPHRLRVGPGLLGTGMPPLWKGRCRNAEGSDIHAQRDPGRDVRWSAGCIWSR